MKHVWLPVILAIFAMFAGGCDSMNTQVNVEEEKKQIRAVIESNIGWAANKDTVMLYNSFAHDDNLFYFCPRDDGTIHGFDAVVELTEGFFLRDEFKAVRFEVKDLHITLSRSGDVAWYHARLDDFNEWNGQPANWEDVRWTGVLEKRDGKWVIVQMHFSSPTDRG